MTKYFSWLSVSEASVHGQLALYFLGCEKNTIGKNTDFIAHEKDGVGRKGWRKAMRRMRKKKGKKGESKRDPVHREDTHSNITSPVALSCR